MIWILAILCAVAVGILSPSGQVASWLALSLGGCVVASLCVQIATREKNGYVDRLTASVIGAAVILGIGGLVFWLVAAAH